MPHNNESLDQLRQDLTELMRRAADIQHRLDALEKDSIPQTSPSPLSTSPEVIILPKPAAPTPQTPAPTAPPAQPAPPASKPTLITQTPKASVFAITKKTSVGEYFQKHIDAIRARNQEIGWEMQLGAYWLPRAAIVCIAIAVVFFLTLAIERWGSTWMPHLRIGIGYAVSLGLMLLAWRSEAKYQGLARVVYGGGFAVMYFVTFATHYVRFARIFNSPAPTLFLLTAIVIVWFIAAQIRQSKIIALLVTALGHLTIFLSLTTLPSPTPIAVAGLVSLGAGSAFFLLRNQWYYVASLGLVGCYLNDFISLAYGQPGNPHTDFAGSLGVAAAFFLIFALAELFANNQLRREQIPAWFRNTFVAINTGAFLIIGSQIMRHFDFSQPHQDLFRITLGAILMMIGLGYLRLHTGDPLFNIYFVKALSLITWGLATRYGGSTLSTWLAIEMIVLMISARRSGIIIMRLIVFAISLLTFAQLINNASLIAFHQNLLSLGPDQKLTLAILDYTSAEYRNALIPAALGILAFFAIACIYQKTNWAERSPRTLNWRAATPEFLTFCWQLDLIAERPPQGKNHPKLAQGLLIPYHYAIAGMILFLVYTAPLLHMGHRFPAITILALLLTIAAAYLNAPPFSLTAALLIILPALATGISEIHQVPLNIPCAIAGIAIAFLAAIASESRFFPNKPGLAFHQTLISPYLFYGVCALLTGVLLTQATNPINTPLALALAALIAAILYLTLHATSFALIAGAYLGWASIIYLPDVYQHWHDNPARYLAATIALTTLSLALDRYFTHLKKHTPAAPFVNTVLIFNALIVLLGCYEISIHPTWLTTVTALTCYGFLIYAIALKAPVAIGAAIAGILFASCRQINTAFNLDTLHPSFIIAFTLLAVFWLLTGHFYRWIELRRPHWLSTASAYLGLPLENHALVMLPFTIATGLLLLMLHRIPHLLPANLAFITMGWFALAILLFLLSLLLHEPHYRYIGLAVIMLTLGRLFLIDMKEQDPILRVAAFAVAGAGLLAISIGYYKWMARTHAEKTTESTAPINHQDN